MAFAGLLPMNVARAMKKNPGPTSMCHGQSDRDFLYIIYNVYLSAII